MEARSGRRSGRAQWLYTLIGSSRQASKFEEEVAPRDCTHGAGPVGTGAAAASVGGGGGGVTDAGGCLGRGRRQREHLRWGRVSPPPSSPRPDRSRQDVVELRRSRARSRALYAGATVGVDCAACGGVSCGSELRSVRLLLRLLTSCGCTSVIACALPTVEVAPTSNELAPPPPMDAAAARDRRVRYSASSGFVSGVERSLPATRAAPMSTERALPPLQVAELCSAWSPRWMLASSRRTGAVVCSTPAAKVASTSAWVTPPPSAVVERVAQFVVTAKVAHLAWAC